MYLVLDDFGRFGRAYASRLAVYEPEHDAAAWLHLRPEPVEDQGNVAAAGRGVRPC